MKNWNEDESALQRRCQKAIVDDGGFVFKVHQDMYTRRGIPDLVACIPATEESIKSMLDAGWFKDNKIGLFVGIETKRPADMNKFDDRRHAQEIVGKEIKNAGGIWYVLDDSDLVKAIVKTIRGELSAV